MPEGKVHNEWSFEPEPVRLPMMELDGMMPEEYGLINSGSGEGNKGRGEVYVRVYEMGRLVINWMKGKFHSRG